MIVETTLGRVGSRQDILNGRTHKTIQGKKLHGFVYNGFFKIHLSIFLEKGRDRPVGLTLYNHLLIRESRGILGRLYRQSDQLGFQVLVDTP